MDDNSKSLARAAHVTLGALLESEGEDEPETESGEGEPEGEYECPECGHKGKAEEFEG